MLSQTQTLKDTVGNDTDYVMIYQDQGGAKRVDQLSTLTEPAVLMIKHQQTGKGNAIVDRHLIQFAKTVLDANSEPRTAIINTTIAVPRSGIITIPFMSNLMAHSVQFLLGNNLETYPAMSAGNLLAALLRGES